MSKDKAPVTAAVRALRAASVPFSDHPYEYEERGGTAVSARELGVDEHAVIKTLVMEDQAMGRCQEIAVRYGDEPAVATVCAMLDRGINSPETSSLGRAFDAAAGLLGVSRRMAFEAESEIALERAAAHHVQVYGWPEPLGWKIDGEGRLDLIPALEALVEEADAGLGAARFHATLVAAMAEWATRAAQSNGIGTVACGGGCFMNKLLSAGLRERFAALGLTMLEAGEASPGDAGIALGARPG